MTTATNSDDPLIKEGKEPGAELRQKPVPAGCFKAALNQQLKKMLKKCHINTNTEGLRYPYLLRLQSSIFILVLVSGCASTPKLDQIPNGEKVSIVVAMNPTADGQTEFNKNNSTGENIGKGAGAGAMGYGVLGVFCGPLAPICVPAMAYTGAIAGAGIGATMSTGGNLSTEQATQLSGRMLRLNESRDKLAELAININDQAGRYWDLSSTEPQTTVRVGMQNLIFNVTDDHQVGAILRVGVTVEKKPDKPPRKSAKPVMKYYESVSPYASLDLWLDEQDDFAENGINLAIREISSQIVSDLATSPATKENLQIAKVKPQTTSNGTSPEFDFYYEAEEEINTNTYDKHLWDKALVESGGDQNRTKARYIELRAKQLYVEKACPVCDASLDQQAASITPDTLITPNTLIDISGTYRSDIIGSGYWSLGRRPAKRVILKQNQDEIVGTFLGSRSGDIEGILNGDTIKFKWFVTDGLAESGRGEWKLTNDGKSWNGTWVSSRGGVRGNWNLTKIE